LRLPLLIFTDTHDSRLIAKRSLRVALIVLCGLLLLAACTGTATPAPVQNLIAYGQTVQGKLSTGETQLIFIGTINDPVTFEFTTTGAPPPVSLIAPDNTSIARLVASTGQVQGFTLPLTGQYTIVIGGGVGDYALTLRPLDKVSAATLAPVTSSATNMLTLGDVRYATLEGLTKPQIWSFEGRSGDTISIQAMTEIFNARLNLRFYLPDGTFAGSSTNNGSSALISGINLPVNGQYHIQVSNVGGPEKVSYTLSLISGAAPTLTPTQAGIINTPSGATATPTAVPLAQTGARIQIGQSVNGVITHEQDVNRFAIFAPAESVISVGMFRTDDSRLAPAFEVYAPNGSQVAQAKPQPNGGAVLSNITLPVTGAYIIFAHANGNQSSGPYTLSIGDGLSLRDVSGGALTPNLPAQGSIQRTGDRQVWTMELLANTTFIVEARPLQTTLQPILDIVAPDGKVIGSAIVDQRSHLTQTQPLVAPVQGTYKIRVSTAAGMSGGAYNISVRILQVLPTPTFSFALDKTVDEKVAKDGKYVLTFKGVPGVLVTINVAGKGQFDPVVELYGPSGRRIVASDDSGSDSPNPFIQTSLDDGAGDYVLQVHGYAMTAGAFTLTIKVE
jgi:hypothetical protein